MPRYALGGAVLESAIALPEVPSRTDAPADYRFEVGPEAEALDAPARVQRRWTQGDDEAATFAWFARQGGDWLVRFPSSGEFLVAEGGRRIVARPRRGVPEATLRHLLLDQVLPLAMSHAGRFALHASGVVLDGRAVAFAARSGSGKSTLAAFLARGGGALLGDDCLVVEPRGGRWVAWPWYPGVRMWPDNAQAAPGAQPVAHYTSKVRVGGALPFRAEPAPLAAVFILAENGDEVSVTPATPRDAVVSIVESTFLLAPDDADALRAQLDFASRLAAAVPCPILRYPYSYDVLPRVRELVLGALAAIEPTPCPSATRA